MPRSSSAAGPKRKKIVELLRFEANNSAMKDDSMTDQQLHEITEAILSGRKIEAIKAYRKISGADLKTAKEAVEVITKSLAKEHPELERSKASGCASVILLGFGLLTITAIGLRYFIA